MRRQATHSPEASAGNEQGECRQNNYASAAPTVSVIRAATK